VAKDNLPVPLLLSVRWSEVAIDQEKEEVMSLKKLMMLAVMLAVVLSAAPAIAQDASQTFSADPESGDASPEVSVDSSGDNSNTCTPIQVPANTGNPANGQGVVQNTSTADDIDSTGAEVPIDASNTGPCEQVVGAGS
jgi:hypothetical protein